MSVDEVICQPAPRVIAGVLVAGAVVLVPYPTLRRFSSLGGVPWPGRWWS